MSGVAEPPRLFRLPAFDGNEGMLTVLEFSPELGFTPRQFNFVGGVPAGAAQQADAFCRRHCLLCLNGAVTIELVRAGRQLRFRLERPDQALLVPAGWRRITRDATTGAVVALLADKIDAAPGADAALAIEEDRALLRVLRSGQYIGGPEVAQFERAFAVYCGVGHAVGVGSGFDALSLALRARGIGRGRSVLLPADAAGAARAVRDSGAAPVFADVAAATGTLDAEAAAAALRSDTAALIAAHRYGNPADMAALRALADDRGLFLLEDATEAQGARYRGRRCGGLGDAAAFGFDPPAGLTALGAAGVLVSDDRGLIEQVRRLGNYGAAEKDHHLVQGVNSRLDPLQAALLLTRLPHLDAWNDRRRALAAHYRVGLCDIPELQLPTPQPGAEPVWPVYALRVPDGRRDSLHQSLAVAGIAAGLPPDPAQGAFPLAARLASEMLTLPLDPFQAEAGIDAAIEHIRAFFTRA